MYGNFFLLVLFFESMNSVCYIIDYGLVKNF